MARPVSQGNKPYQVILHRQTKDGKVEDVLTLSFGSRASNDINCAAAVRQIGELICAGQFVAGADVLKITGPAAIAIAFALGLALQPVACHYKEVVIFDRGLSVQSQGRKPFIVVYSAPDSEYRVGDRVD